MHEENPLISNIPGRPLAAEVDHAGEEGRVGDLPAPGDVQLVHDLLTSHDIA